MSQLVTHGGDRKLKVQTMKETSSIPKDKIENVKQVEVQKQLQLAGRVIPQRGHTLFEYDKVTGTVVKAEFEEVKDVKFGASKSPWKQVTTKKVVRRENCIYVSALNLKNALKKLGLEVLK